jgi:hypothetical protein
MLLEQLLANVPEGERGYAAENPQALARLATRAEVRQPGLMEHMFSRMPAAAPGFGGVLGGSLLGSLAGTVLGTMIAQNFLGSHGVGHGLLGGDHAQDVSSGAQDPGSDFSDIGSALDDFGSGFDGSVDV